MHIVYLHGFLSGGKSVKGQMLQQALEGLAQVQFEAPDYPDSPDAAESYLADFFAALQTSGETVGVFGSSMGGFWASVFAERCGFKAVLLNPCVGPSAYLPTLSTEQYNPYSQERFTLTAAHLQLMRKLEAELAATLNPRRYLVCLQTGDEVLDYRKAQRFYTGAQFTLTQGGCHAFANFAAVIAPGLTFLQDAAL